MDNITPEEARAILYFLGTDEVKRSEISAFNQIAFKLSKIVNPEVKPQKKRRTPKKKEIADGTS